MNDKPLTIALVGIGGYGNTYVQALLDAPAPLQSTFKLVAAIDPNPAACRHLAGLQARGVPVLPSLDSFYASSSRADLLILSTPIALHAPQTTLALSHGGNVLCEKPLCATLDDARAMLAARDRFGGHVAVGYQWSFSAAVQRLKADVLSGVLGRPKRLRTLVLWPRDEAYYGRNRWAGAKRDAHGNFVWDSPVNNACAHYLHNMLYVTGPRVDRSANPATLLAELYRAHPIENYDTGALRITTDDGVELLFVVSHATGHRVGPIFSYEFERGTVDFAAVSPAADDRIVATLRDGSTIDYGSPNEARDGKIWKTLDAVRAGAPSVCGIEAALPHAQSAAAAQDSMPDIQPFPRDIVRVSGEAGHRKTVVDGLDDVLRRCYDEWRLPSELGVAWAKAGTTVSVEPMLSHPPAPTRRAPTVARA